MHIARIGFTLIVLLALNSCVHSQEAADKEASRKVDRQEIRKTMEAHRKYIGDCYGKALLNKKNAHLKGKVLVNFNIGPDGRAHKAQVLPKQSTIQDKGLHQCIIAGVSSWDFPVHPDGKDVTVNYPLFFRSAPPRNMQKKMDQFENLRRIQSTKQKH